MADNTKMLNKLKKKFEGKPWMRKMSILSSDYVSGQVIIFDETLPDEERAEVIMSSASIPFVFPGKNIDDMHLYDGGLYSSVSVGDPIERCREEGVSDADIIVDVILCYGPQVFIEPWQMEETRWMTAYDYKKRREEIFYYMFWKEDILTYQRGYPHVDFRLVVQPSEEIKTHGWLPINTNRKDVEYEINLGFDDAVNAMLDLQERGFDSYDFSELNNDTSKKNKK